MRRPFIAGNWKMNLGQADALRLAKAIRERCASIPDRDVAICPTFVSIAAVAAELTESPVAVGGQDCAEWDDGAYTGAISASILRSTGARYVILGHSERRHVMGETDEVIRTKMGKARAAGLRPILCVGETLEERKSGQTLQVVERQLRSGLEGLTVVDDLRIQDNNDLVTLDGLDNLTEVLGSMYIEGNDALVDLHGLNALTEVGGEAYIGGFSWQSGNPSLLDVDGLAGLRVVGQSLLICENIALTSVAGLHGVDTVAYTLYICNNPELPSSEAQALADAIPAKGNVSIYGNGPG